MVIFEKKVCFSGMPGKIVCFAGNLLVTTALHKNQMAARFNQETETEK